MNWLMLISRWSHTQVKSYNPYYALVEQHVITTSHSHRITLQFCLWDFLRDMGEANIGGAEVIRICQVMILVSEPYQTRE